MQKILLVLGVVCVQLAFGVFTEDDLRPTNKECLKELNLGADVLIKNFNQDWTVTEGNNDLNSVSLCTFRKEHFLKNGDTLDVNKYKDFLINEFFVKAKLNFDNPTEAAIKGIVACKSVQGSDIGDTIIKHYNCIVNYFKKNV